jgi:CubicO group peptidase (beta-lactamase class C family)
VDDGKIDLDDRLISFFPDRAPAEPSENLRQVRVRDLLTMKTTGSPAPAR